MVYIHAPQPTTSSYLGHDSSYSMGDDTLTPTEPTLGEGSPQVEPYVQRIFRDPPTLTKATGQSGSKVCLKKSSSSLDKFDKFNKV